MASQLTDQQYQELIGLRVLDTLRTEHAHSRRWMWGIMVAVISVAIGILQIQYSGLSQDYSGLSEDVEPFSARPYIDGISSAYSDLDEIIVNGTHFGTVPGSVEIYYKRRSDGTSAAGTPATVGTTSARTRSDTITFEGTQISSWIDQQIIVTPTPSQRNTFLTSIQADNFESLVPYIRVVIPDGRRSPVW